ncbi:MAG: ACP phosphodiesterase [Cyclobacteriaceae bacterium]
MNFLAHLFLSGDNQELRLGNFSGDFVKGNQMNIYPDQIAQGIKLHREIDRFTDTHQIVLLSKKRLRPKYRHYSPVIIDVFYDHFLASLWADYHPQPLEQYVNEFYRYTETKLNLLPVNAQHTFKYMKRDNWLYNYQYIEGIDRALTGMSRRTLYESKMDEATLELKKDYELFKSEFQLFFPVLIQHVSNFISE